MIPSYEPLGTLPPGIHVAAWADMTSRFGTTGHRRALLGGLLRGTRILISCGCTGIYVDGSFVTSKTCPSDFDCCWEMQGVDLAALKKKESAFFSFANKRAVQRAKFFGEFFPAKHFADSHQRTFLDFFQQDSHTGLAKGIIKVDLDTLP